jgi:hypothetical protein
VVIITHGPWSPITCQLILTPRTLLTGMDRFLDAAPLSRNGKG